MMIESKNSSHKLYYKNPFIGMSEEVFKILMATFPFLAERSSIFIITSEKFGKGQFLGFATTLKAAKEMTYEMYTEQNNHCFYQKILRHGKSKN